MLRRRLLILGIVVVFAVVVFAIIGLLSTQPKLTLHAGVVPDSLEINGANVTFTDGMKVDYTKPLAIKVTKKGYQDLSITLDPKNSPMKEYTIALLPNPDPLASIPVPAFGPLPNEQGPLLQAAKNSDNTLLDFGDALNVDILETKSFQGGNYIAYRVKKKPPVVTDPAFLIVENSPDGYVMSLGPGTTFGSADEYIDTYPDEIIQYMKDKHYVN
jgi:hypothetical protein